MLKEELGQFYTIENPFLFKPFLEWFEKIPNKDIILEPFAGECNICEMFKDYKWACYDIIKPNTVKYNVIQQDTIKNFPTGFSLSITNPPYLAKNSAKRKNLIYNYNEYDDLYKKCIEVMLNNCEYVAAIIPASFIQCNELKERCEKIILLEQIMFNDTNCPTCLALFSKTRQEYYELYKLNNYICKNTDINKIFPEVEVKNKWKINDPSGKIGIKCIDNIQFIDGNTIDSKNIKRSSRTYTRVSVNTEIKDMDLFLSECNKILNNYREQTQDIFLSVFKSLGRDGKFRRRLDFFTAKQIMEKAYNNIKNIKYQ